VRKLIPLQGALGMVDVQAKANDIKQDCAHERNVGRNPIEVIEGPDSGLYIVDHHHSAGTWLLAEHPEAQCVIVDRKTSGSKDDFWQRWRKVARRTPETWLKIQLRKIKPRTI
jgi:hypothetical protein